MKKALFVLVALVAAATVGISASPALATGACDSNSQGYSYAGLSNPAGTTVPGVGVSASMTAKLIGADTSVVNGHIADWVGVNDSTLDRWIQTGISGFPGTNNYQLYIEVKFSGQAAQYFPEGTALADTAYNASIYHVSNGVWTATINGHSLTETLGGTMTTTYEGAEDWTPTPPATCNAYFFTTWNIQPWTTGQMGHVVSGDNFLTIEDSHTIYSSNTGYSGGGGGCGTGGPCIANPLPKLPTWTNP